MKKHSALMRASGILLVLTLGTSCFVGGTFAKYVSMGEATDSARVAKWGVTVTAKNNTTFSKEYAKNSVDYNDTEVGNDGNTVWTNQNYNIVAPGTKGNFGGYDENGNSLAGITISGQPEVAVKIDTVATVELGTDEDWEVGKDDTLYCPLVFHVGDETICGLDYPSNKGGIAGFETAIANAIAKTTYNPDLVNNDNANHKNVYPAGTSLDNVKVNFSWEWPFAGSTQTVGNGYGTGHEEQTDELDTLLGDKFLDDKAPEISIKVTTTVTQID